MPFLATLYNIFIEIDLVINILVDITGYNRSFTRAHIDDPCNDTNDVLIPVK